MKTLEQLQVVKRNGQLAQFQMRLIQEAIFKAAYNADYEDNQYHKDPIKANHLANTVASLTTKDILELISTFDEETNSIDIDAIQNIVVDNLSEIAPRVGHAYLNYKTVKNIERG